MAVEEMATLDEVAPVAPLWVEVTRGPWVESRHRVSAAAVDPEGRVVFRAGDIAAPVYPRSAVKPIQALAFLEAGAAEAYDCSDAEVALACASHSGEPRHVAAVAAWLARIGCSERDLECGAHVPASWGTPPLPPEAGEAPSQLHNNCSGKHTGFLTLARHQGWPTAGYIDYAHPVQQRVIGVVESMCGLDLADAPRGTDGCGIPTIAMPLGNLALALARLIAPDDQPERRRAACARVCRAMAAEPFMVAGSGRFCTRAMEATAGRALVKTGAEGVFAAALPELGLGVALKAEDGAGRASQAAMAYLLDRLGALDDGARAALADLLEPSVDNRVGKLVGRIRVAEGDGEG